LLAQETENHILSYLDFKGVIPSGYGAGTVDIVDKGTYTMNKIGYDKKYVFTLHGRKIKDTYALIKTGNKSFLWIKTKKDSYKKTASTIDYVQPSLPPQIFDLNGPGHMPYM